MLCQGNYYSFRLLCGLADCWGARSRGSSPWQGLAARTHPTTPARSRADEQAKSQALGIRHLPRDGDGLRLCWNIGRWVQASGTHGWVGKVCGEMETVPVVASLGQGLMAPGADLGFCTLKRVWGGSGELGQDSKAWW